VSLHYLVKCQMTHSSRRRHWPVAWSIWSSLACGPPNNPNLHPVDCCSRCSSTDGLSLSILTIHDSQPAKESHCPWVGQSAAAFDWSRHWSVASPASMRRPAARRTHWKFDVKTVKMWFLDNNWDNKRVVSVVNFLKCVVTKVVLFLIVILKWHFTR